MEDTVKIEKTEQPIEPTEEKKASKADAGADFGIPSLKGLVPRKEPSNVKHLGKGVDYTKQRLEGLVEEYNRVFPNDQYAPLRLVKKKDLPPEAGDKKPEFHFDLPKDFITGQLRSGFNGLGIILNVQSRPAEADIVTAGDAWTQFVEYYVDVNPRLLCLLIASLTTVKCLAPMVMEKATGVSQAEVAAFIEAQNEKNAEKIKKLVADAE